MGSVFFLYVSSCFGWGSWLVLVSFLIVLVLLYGLSCFCYVLLSGWFGSDQLSCVLVTLSFVVLVVSLVSSYKDLRLGNEVHENNGDDLVELIVLTVLGSVIFFSVSNWMDLYFFFEFSLVPVFLLVLIWGYQPERLQAGLYLIMYTASASLPILLVFISFWLCVGSDNMLLVKCLSIELISNGTSWVWFCICFGFLVKLPVYFFHGWLPKAHVEAPLSGSMFLAGILLNFGAYGLIRVLWMTEFPMCGLIFWLIALSLWGGLVSSCLCCCQTDLNSFIAYSSIGHIAVCLGGLLSMYSLGNMSAVCLLFAHGLVSPALFSLSAAVYDFVGTRNVIISNGLLCVFPLLSVFWFLCCVANIGFPPSLNFVGEVFCLSSGIWLHWVFSIPLSLMVFITGCYSLMLYSWVNHGCLSEIVRPVWGVSVRYSYSALFILVVLLFGVLGMDFYFV